MLWISGFSLTIGTWETCELKLLLGSAEDSSAFPPNQNKINCDFLSFILLIFLGKQGGKLGLSLSNLDVCPCQMCKLVFASCGYNKHEIHEGKRKEKKSTRNLTLLVATAIYRDRRGSHTYLKGNAGERLVANLQCIFC